VFQPGRHDLFRQAVVAQGLGEDHLAAVEVAAEDG